MVALGKDYVDENELTIIASRLGTTVDYLTGKTDDSGVSIQQQIDAAITAKEADELTAIFERLSVKIGRSWFSTWNEGILP